MKPSFAQRYGKALTSTFFAALVALYAATSGDNRIEPAEWVAIAIAATGAVATYVVPLAPQYPWAKSAINALLAALQVMATLIIGGLDSNEWILIALAVGQALGVVAAPAVSNNGVASRGSVAPAR